MTHRSTIVTRVTTAEGIVGEAYAGDEDASLLDVKRIVDVEIAPRLLGEDAYAVERCWELARPATFDILRDRRHGLVACACVDAAIWDARATAQLLNRARSREGIALGEREDMGLAGVLTLSFLSRQFGRDFSRRVQEARGKLDRYPMHVFVDQTGAAKGAPGLVRQTYE